jgi:hypothetical protein
MARSEAVKEIRIIFYLLMSMFIEVKLPIIVRCDNVGVIFTAENSSSGVCTRHVDTRHRFVCEHIVDGFIKIVFVKSCASPIFFNLRVSLVYERISKVICYVLEQ